MSRELKFRAWDKKRKCYAKVIQTTNQGWKGYRDKTYITNGIMCFSKWVLSRFIIEQYTGLKDKNGKEIYEGDVVGKSIYGFDSEKNEEYLLRVEPWGVVIFEDGAFGVRAESPFAGQDSYFFKVNDSMVVIGNIHENPELIGGEE